MTPARLAHKHHDPDEVPHDVIGILAITIVLIALVAGLVWTMFGPGGVAIYGLVVSVIGIRRLSRRAARERIDEAKHPTVDKPISPHDKEIS